MATKPMWMVRAGSGAASIANFREKKVVGIGWGSEDWLRYSDRDAILQMLVKVEPDKSPAQSLAGASQIDRFIRAFKVGDRVITYDPSRRSYLIGTISGQAVHDPQLLPELPTVRKVTWDGEVPRDALSVSTRNSLGAIMTLFRIPDEATQEIEALAAGKVSEQAVAEQEELEGVVDVLKDIQSRSHEFIKDRLSRLDWEQMQELIAGLLRAMGYKTRISPQGPD